MYAIAILRYRKPLEDVLKHIDSHRAYLAGLKQEGLLIASGPLVPRNGGALLLRVPDDEAQATLDSIRDNDPFTRFGLAQYEMWPWAPDDWRRGTGPLVSGLANILPLPGWSACLRTCALACLLRRQGTCVSSPPSHLPPASSPPIWHGARPTSG